jgi:DnaK suppressor protein
MPRAQKASNATQASGKKAASAKDAAVKVQAAGHEPAAKETTKKQAAKSGAPAAAKATKEVSKTAAKTTKAAKAAPAKHDGGEGHDKFLEEQRELLHTERREYVQKAEELKAEADSLARESEPGDIQFDEEGGEGGTASIDREVDLVLSAQARAAVDEIDRALLKIDAGTYGICENCGQPIPRARLKALPYAALCVQCKSGGLSRR